MATSYATSTATSGNTLSESASSDITSSLHPYSEGDHYSEPLTNTSDAAVNFRSGDFSECFLLHGYPHWFYEQQRASTNNSGAKVRERGGRSTSTGGRFGRLI